MFNSSLYNELTFYRQFYHDLLDCTEEVVIESPYISNKRMAEIFPIFEKLLSREVKIYVVTRKPKEHMRSLAEQAEAEIQRFERVGVHTLLCPGSHHRKLAILDRKILWEGSLNILSQTDSRELMRRIEGEEYAQEMLTFTNLMKYLR